MVHHADEVYQRYTLPLVDTLLIDDRADVLVAVTKYEI